MSECAGKPTSTLRTEVDFVNLRQVGTILQKEVIYGGHRIFTDGTMAADLFEIYALKAYQKLHEERSEIVAEGLRSGRFY
ncbi:MAG: hypothetical protein AAF708_05460 [Deinococcota bacterium]